MSSQNERVPSPSPDAPDKLGDILGDISDTVAKIDAALCNVLLRVRGSTPPSDGCDTAADDSLLSRAKGIRASLRRMNGDMSELDEKI